MQERIELILASMIRANLKDDQSITIPHPDVLEEVGLENAHNNYAKAIAAFINYLTPARVELEDEN